MPFLLLCREDNPFAQMSSVPWTALNEARLVLQDYSSGSRQLIDKALEEFSVKTQVIQEIGHPATLFPMVEAGIGISIFPALALPLPSGSQLVIRPLLPEVNRALMLVKRKNRSLTPAALAIWQVVKQQAQALTDKRERVGLNVHST